MALHAKAGGTVFQSPLWLESWYASRTRDRAIEPLIVFVSDTRTGRDVMGLPFVRLRHRGRSTILFADLGITDYNAPLLTCEAPSDAAGAASMWRAVRKALPNCDTICLEKMPPVVEGRANPLALLPSTRASRLNGNILHVDGPWDDYHWGLERTFRKELERSWRVFEKHENAQFRIVTERKEALRLLRELSQLQERRIAELGLPYVLDEPCNAAFFETLVGEGIESGAVVLSVLTAGETLVAALLGITRGRHYAMVRLAQAGGPWKNCSPGRLVIERTMRALHERGYRAFDFTTGDYAYKRRMGVTPLALAERLEARSLKGLALVWTAAARARLRQSPLARRIWGTGRPRTAVRR